MSTSTEYHPQHPVRANKVHLGIFRHTIWSLINTGGWVVFGNKDMPSTRRKTSKYSYVASVGIITVSTHALINLATSSPHSSPSPDERDTSGLI